MFEELKQELIKYGNLIWANGYNPGINGNLSIRCGNKIIITATETYKKDLQLEDFVVVDYAKNIIEGDKKYSSETSLHIEYYKQRPDINCIFHVHSTYLGAFAIANEAPDTSTLPEIICGYKYIPLSEYALPGSDKLVKNNSKYFKDFDVILMKNHGVIVAGETPQKAFINLETCEKYAQKLIYAKILGGAKMLPADEINEIEKLRQAKYKRN